MTKTQFEAQSAALLSARELIGDVAYTAAVSAIEDQYFEAVKAAQSAKWDKTRLTSGAAILKGHLLADLPGLKVTFENFDTNGENASPTMTVSISETNADGATKTRYLFGAPMRKRRAGGGKIYRGAVVTLREILLSDGTVKVAKGVEFDSTKALAEAIGYDKGKFGYYNELRSHGHARGKTWDYTQAVADAKAGAAKVTEPTETTEDGTEGS